MTTALEVLSIMVVGGLILFAFYSLRGNNDGK